MSQTFKTQADVMVSTAGRVDNTNDEVQGELTRLQGVVDSVRGSWAGQAQVSFDNLMQRYSTSAQQLREALTSISENIRSNARNFDNVEAENTQAFSNVGGGLALYPSHLHQQLRKEAFFPCPKLSTNSAPSLLPQLISTPPPAASTAPWPTSNPASSPW